jgi:hypothetical protein
MAVYLSFQITYRYRRPFMRKLFSQAAPAC